jgi:hypothetical protein
MAVKVTCVSKPSGNNLDPHEAISRIGWLNESTGAQGVSTRLEIYDFIKGGGQVYVTGLGSSRVYVGCRENSIGTKFVQTYADGQWNNNLLSQPNCT